MDRNFISGRAIPLRRNNIDTDQIIPARFCYHTERTGHSDSLFGNWRKDPNFVLNDNRFKGGNILITGKEFATGSSREYAVWALKNYGIDVIVAPSFGDIFYKSSIINDLLPLIVSEDQINLLWDYVEANPNDCLFINLKDNTITFKKHIFHLDIEEHFKEKYILKLNDLSISLSHDIEIREYESKRNINLPSTLFLHSS